MHPEEKSRAPDMWRVGTAGPATRLVDFDSNVGIHLNFLCGRANFGDFYVALGCRLVNFSCTSNFFSSKFCTNFSKEDLILKK